MESFYDPRVARNRARKTDLLGPPRIDWALGGGKGRRATKIVLCADLLHPVAMQQRLFKLFLPQKQTPAGDLTQIH
jgi:hypothetical protein